MLPAESRLPDISLLIERQEYFTVHAPRQSGKTTALRSLARRLNSEGRYTVLLFSCETGARLEGDLDASIDAVIDTLRQQAETELEPDLWPPAPDPAQPASTRLRGLLSRWARASPRPLVLFFDEVDSLRDEALLSLLRQLRSGFDSRPSAFPQSVALIGLRDIRDYRIASQEGMYRLGTESPFNINVESIRLRNFSRAEIDQLCRQHTAEVGQIFAEEAIERIWQLSQGQPWLVNALAGLAVEKFETDPTREIQAGHIDAAKEELILKRGTHLDSLVDRLREPRVQRVLEPILAGQLLAPNVLDDDLEFAKDLGLVVEGPDGVGIANPIYYEVIPRALSALLQGSIQLPAQPFVDGQGMLDARALLSSFGAFWREHSATLLQQSPWAEAAAHLIFMAFLQRLINGGGSVDREYGIGRGRIDLLIRWPAAAPRQRIAIELKVWRPGAANPVPAGLDQLHAYLERLTLESGFLVVFDQRSGNTGEAHVPDLVSHRGKSIEVWRF